MSDKVKAVLGGIFFGLLIVLCIFWFITVVSASEIEESTSGVVPQEVKTEQAQEPTQEPPQEPEPEQEQSTSGVLTPAEQETPPDNEPFEFDGSSADFASRADSGEAELVVEESTDNAMYLAVGIGIIAGAIAGLAFVVKWGSL